MLWGPYEYSLELLQQVGSNEYPGFHEEISGISFILVEKSIFSRDMPSTVFFFFEKSVFGTGFHRSR